MGEVDEDKNERNEINEIIEYYVIHVIQPILEIKPSNELKLIKEIKARLKVNYIINHHKHYVDIVGMNCYTFYK